MADIILEEELKQLKKIVTLREENELLMDTMVNLLTRTIQFCHEKEIPIENEIPIKTMLSEARKMLQERAISDS